MTQQTDDRPTKPRPTWIASDMDETFLTPDHTVALSTQLTYRRVMDAGIPIIPCTGRSYFALKRVVSMKTPDFYPHMQLTPGVYLNGTCVFGETPDDIIYAAPMPAATLRAFLTAYYSLVDKGELNRGTIFLQHPRGSMIDFENRWFKEHCDRWDEEVPSVVAGRTLVEVLDENPSLHCCQVSIVGDPRDIVQFEQAVANNEELNRQLTDEHIVLRRPIAPMLTALHNVEHKAKGLSKLSERYPHLKLDDVLTIGDGNNDIEMLRMAKWAIAMGQAPEIVKDAAKSLTASNGDDGWAKGISEAVFPSCE
eukprot:Protomagalhaensia_wolfi_Nauph_80__2147@NODE_2380_length_1110_cov_16_920635_g1864_i0_p1_GENE_NODE_2380_length_1110_cov_16_920635_g1864_i0NODE_2380_length_1110_cov_16_920635_g1864_i0_p1_ORF_typecomplete_len309_score48_84Hydrolase_3/PF08282_12/8_6e40S6PP/PF05116_13/1_1e03S6PP/PF05116_13/4_8e03S6PP/PF05116_13/0_0045HAD/PF12710_7/8_1e02HAD/PF12710_7/0_054_NODE_2380_length_1110_cov_16_920635_g1864_i068994